MYIGLPYMTASGVLGAAEKPWVFFARKNRLTSEAMGNLWSVALRIDRQEGLLGREMRINWSRQDTPTTHLGN